MKFVILYSTLETGFNSWSEFEADTKKDAEDFAQENAINLDLKVMHVLCVESTNHKR